MSRPHRSKATGTHTTYIANAVLLRDMWDSMEEVERIVCGVIVNHGGSGAGSTHAVKITDLGEPALVFHVVQPGSIQELKVYPASTPGARQKVKLTTAQFVRSQGWELSFHPHKGKRKASTPDKKSDRPLTKRELKRRELRAKEGKRQPTLVYLPPTFDW